MKDTERLIFDRICRKERGSLEECYKFYYKKLYVIAYKYLRNEEVAQEVVNDVFLKIWNDADSITINQSLGHYLSRCVVNASLNVISKEKNIAGKKAYFLAGFNEANEEDDEAELLELQLNRLEEAIDQLPPQCKKVLMMSKFGKQKQQEIADSLNISIKTVKNHLSQGYEKLRIALTSELAIAIFFSIKFLF